MKAKFIYEKFTEESDPIHDLGIGYIRKIKKWMKDPKIVMHLKSPFIRNDLKIDASYVDISNEEYKIIPEYIKFGRIEDKFICHFEDKEKIKQLPEYVGGELKIYVSKDPDFTIKDITNICKVHPRHIVIKTYHHPDYNDFVILKIK
jgi:hypothetical protein